jgi:hypothetical protein
MLVNEIRSVMSPNATLLAYSGSPNIQQLRDQAALLSQVWKEYKDKIREQQSVSMNSASDQLSSSSSTASTIVEGALETLTIENAKSNIIIRAVQPRLLLVLIGGSPPHRASDYFKVTAEARGDPRYPPETAIADAGSTDSPYDSAQRSPPTELLTQTPEEAVIETPMPDKYHDITATEKMEMLSIQRQKIDAATDYMRSDFTNKGFIMPDELSIP